MYTESDAATRLDLRLRYSDSTSDAESCASDCTADYTTHSAGTVHQYAVSFRPRSAHEPPVPADFLRRQSSEFDESESYDRRNDGMFVQPSARRRKSNNSVMSEHSGYVSSQLPTPRHQRSEDPSDSEHPNQSHPFCKPPDFGRTSSANSSTVFDWSGLANGRARDSITSQTSEYSAYASETSPRRRDPNRYVRAQAGRNRHVVSHCHSSYKRVLECHDEQRLEPQHSFSSSASSGKSIADIMYENDQQYDSDDATSDVSSFSADKYPNSSYTESVVHQDSHKQQQQHFHGSRTLSNNVPYLFIPSAHQQTVDSSQSVDWGSSDRSCDEEAYQIPNGLRRYSRPRFVESHACQPEMERHSTTNRRTQVISRPFAVLQGEDAVKAFTRSRSFLARMKAMFG